MNSQFPTALSIFSRKETPVWKGHMVPGRSVQWVRFSWSVRNSVDCSVSHSFHPFAWNTSISVIIFMRCITGEFFEESFSHFSYLDRSDMTAILYEELSACLCVSR
jgi:hypothetical protein